MKNETKDLMLNLSESSQRLVDNNIIDPKLLLIRQEIQDIDISKLDKFNDSILYAAYTAANKNRTASKRIIAKNLNISTKLYDYYLEKYPQLGAIVQLGVADAREQMACTVVDSLYNAATGQSIEEQSVSTETIYDSDGAEQGSKEKITKVTKYIPPNVTAALEIMKRLDPAWTPQVDVNVSGSVDYNFNVAKDINVAVDYKQLSVSALKELIDSQKPLNTNDTKSFKNEDNISVYTQNKKESEVKDIEKPSKPKKKPKSSKTRKTKTLLDNHASLVEKCKQQAKKEASK